MTNRLSRDSYFGAIATVTATRSTCPRAQVGAVAVKDNHIIMTGYNGALSGDEHCIDAGCIMYIGHCIRSVHAEANIVIHCAKYGINLSGSKIYVTHKPCNECMKLLIGARVSEIIYLNEYEDDKQIPITNTIKMRRLI